ncbi:MAG: hypothetical protein LUD77_05310 [Clostridiales bacterium]|nr:hypothetical protein [Clostridiales bacterium]
MKHFKRLAAAVVAGAMILQTAAFQGITAFADTSATFTSCGGWYETAYATWSDADALNAAIYYKSTDSDTYTQLNSSDDVVDTSLKVYDGSHTYYAAGYKQCVVSYIDSAGRVDIMGIGYGSFDIQVVTSGNITYETSVTILQEDRSGYAHFGASSDYIGAYTDEGVLKDNATVIYVTKDNKNSVTWSGNIGIGEIASHLYKDTQNGTGNSYAVRFLGEVDTTAWEATSYSNNTYYISETKGKSAGTYTNWYEDLNNKSGSYYADTTNTGTRIDNLNTKFTIYTSSNSVSITTIDGSTYTDSVSGVFTISETSSSTGEDTSLNMMDFKGGSSTTPYYLPRLTIEGVGTDTVAKNWGITITRGSGTEVRNINFVSSPEDACSADSSYYVWIHRCTFDVGANHCDLTDANEQDKHEGDGSSDFTEDYNVTCSYNVYNNCHKTSLNGGSNSTKQYNYTYHHNYYNSCTSRLPMARYVNVHNYNNYTLGASSGTTGISARASAFVFSEANYYTGCTYALETQSDSTYGDGFIKSYNDTITNPASSTYPNSTRENGTTNCINTASSRETTYSPSNSKHTGDDAWMDNFDVDSTNFYYDSTNKVSNVSYLTSASVAVTYVTTYSGVMQDKTYEDIMNNTSDSGDDDTGDETDGVITSEQSVTVDDYTSNSYFTVDNPGTTTASGVFRITKNSTVSFTTGIDGATVTVVGKHASGTAGEADRTLYIYNSSDATTNCGSIVYEQGVDPDSAGTAIASDLSAGSYYLQPDGDLNITSITVSFPSVIYDTATLTFTNSVSSDVTITENSSAYSDYFTLLATSDVDSSNKYTGSLTVSSKNSRTFAEYVTYDYCLKSGGTTVYTDSIPTARAIKFVTAGSGVVQLLGISSNTDGTTRNAKIYSVNDVSTLDTYLSVSSNSDGTVSNIITLPSAGTYYVVFEKAISLYAVNVAVGVAIETDSNGSGYIITDGSDSYIVAGTTISDSDFESYSDMTVEVKADNTESVSTGTVYAAAVVDGFIIQPSELGDSYTYVYIVKIEDSAGATDFSYSTSLTEIAAAETVADET